MHYNTTEGMAPWELHFRRKFAYNPCNTLQLPLGEMSLHRDWLHTDGRGDPYPVLDGCGAVRERISCGTYFAESPGEGSLTRLIGRFFPYATYALSAVRLDDGCALGFSFRATGGGASMYAPENAPEVRIFLRREAERLALCRETLVGGRIGSSETVAADILPEEGLRLQITWQACAAVITLCGAERRQFVPLVFPEFASMDHQATFSATTAGLFCRPARGTVAAQDIRTYLDGGVCQADPRPIRFEDGTPFMEGGRLYLTWSVRAGIGGFQAVISWIPSLCDFRMEGALFFDYGDGRWHGDVATSLIYDRSRSRWLLWACAFKGGHYLMHAEPTGDPRFGIHIIDAERMPTESGIPGEAALSDDTLWLGKQGDEDPDLLYDAATGLWHMSICRVSEVDGVNTYCYYLFTSKEPFSGYTFAGRVADHGVTGGTLLPFNGRKYLVYGRRFDARAEYACVPLEDPAHPRLLSCDYDDGGFRGWGTVIPVPCGSRTSWYWLTFDRDLGHKADNWSYGNLYVYEADEQTSPTDR